MLLNLLTWSLQQLRSTIKNSSRKMTSLNINYHRHLTGIKKGPIVQYRGSLACPSTTMEWATSFKWPLLLKSLIKIFQWLHHQRRKFSIVTNTSKSVITIMYHKRVELAQSRILALFHLRHLTVAPNNKR